ncbi:MAG: cytochrome P450 [Nannocystaceae bacterium]
MSVQNADLTFDPYAPGFVEDPYPILARLREEAPIYRWDAARAHIFFRFRDVMPLFKEPRLGTDPTFGAGFTAELRAAYPDFVAIRENDLMMMSAASHARIRKLVAPYFSPRSLEAHLPGIERVIDEVLGGLPSEGRVNLAVDFSRRYPVRVIASLLAIPPGSEEVFVAMAEALIATILPGLPPERFASYMGPIAAGVGLVRELIAERRARPLEGDLFSAMIHACDAEERLSDGELLSLIGGILTGGSDTTVHLTTYALLNLLRHPDQLALVREDPSLIRMALDETLRFDSFGRGAGLARFVTEPLSYQGVDLQVGEVVFLNLAAAFRDPEFVADPDVFDIRRRTHTSPWFGNGPHFCLGAALARLEAEAAIRRLLQRYAEIELVGPPVYGDHPVFREIVDLPLRVRAR